MDRLESATSMIFDLCGNEKLSELLLIKPL